MGKIGRGRVVIPFKKKFAAEIKLAGSSTGSEIEADLINDRPSAVSGGKSRMKCYDDEEEIYKGANFEKCI